MEKKVLLLTFLDETDKDYRLRLEEPKEDLEAAQVSNVMDRLVTSGVFPQEGSLSQAKKAEIITTKKEVLFEQGQES